MSSDLQRTTPVPARFVDRIAASSVFAGALILALGKAAAHRASRKSAAGKENLSSYSPSPGWPSNVAVASALLLLVSLCLDSFGISLLFPDPAAGHYPDVLCALISSVLRTLASCGITLLVASRAAAIAYAVTAEQQQALVDAGIASNSNSNSGSGGAGAGTGSRSTTVSATAAPLPTSAKCDPSAPAPFSPLAAYILAAIQLVALASLLGFTIVSLLPQAARWPDAGSVSNALFGAWELVVASVVLVCMLFFEVRVNAVLVADTTPGMTVVSSGDTGGAGEDEDRTSSAEPIDGGAGANTEESESESESDRDDAATPVPISSTMSFGRALAMPTASRLGSSVPSARGGGGGRSASVAGGRTHPRRQRRTGQPAPDKRSKTTRAIVRFRWVYAVLIVLLFAAHLLERTVKSIQGSGSRALMATPRFWGAAWTLALCRIFEFRDEFRAHRIAKLEREAASTITAAMAMADGGDDLDVNVDAADASDLSIPRPMAPLGYARTSSISKTPLLTPAVPGGGGGGFSPDHDIALSPIAPGAPASPSAVAAELAEYMARTYGLDGIYETTVPMVAATAPPSSSPAADYSRCGSAMSITLLADLNAERPTQAVIDVSDDEQLTAASVFDGSGTAAAAAALSPLPGKREEV